MNDTANSRSISGVDLSDMASRVERRGKLMKSQQEIEEALAVWLGKRSTPFVLSDVASQVFGQTKVDRSLATQVGIGLVHLGCKKLEDRFARPRFFYRPPAK